LKSGEYKTRKINTVDWKEQDRAEEWRAAWRDAQNAALKQQGHAARVDHHSYARQGKDQMRSDAQREQPERTRGMER